MKCSDLSNGDVIQIHLNKITALFLHRAVIKNTNTNITLEHLLLHLLSIYIFLLFLFKWSVFFQAQRNDRSHHSACGDSYHAQEIRT